MGAGSSNDNGEVINQPKSKSKQGFSSGYAQEVKAHIDLTSHASQTLFEQDESSDRDGAKNKNKDQKIYMIK